MKRYLISFAAALLCHALVFLLPGTKPVSSVSEDSLMELQLFNETPPPDPVPQAPPPPPPPTKVPPEKPPEDIIPEPDVIAEEEEIVEKKIPEASSPEVPLSRNTSQRTSPTHSPVTTDIANLDNAQFEPFGNKKPAYPSLARKAGIEGWVSVKVLVNEKGKVIKTEVVEFSGHPSFKQSTLDVASGWRFPIPISKNQRVRTWYTKRIEFRLTD